MNGGGNMESVLVVSAPKGQEAILQLLNQGGGCQPQSVPSGGEARRLLLETGYDLVVINAPLSDEFGAELALYVAQQGFSGVILLVRREQADMVSAKVEDYGVFVVEKPLSRQMFYQALRLVAASRRRMLGLKQENARLMQKIEEIRLVDRAKCALIQYLGMTEQQAHRYLEKQAMDLRVTRREVAQGILKTYES